MDKKIFTTDIEYFEKKHEKVFNSFIKEIDFVVSYLNKEETSIEKINKIYEKTFYLLSDFINYGITDKDFENLSKKEQSDIIESIIEKYKKQVKDEKEFLFVNIIAYIIINKIFFLEKIDNPDRISPLSFFALKNKENEYNNKQESLLFLYNAEQKKVFLKGSYSPLFMLFEAVKNSVGEKNIIFGGDMKNYALARMKNIYLENFEKEE